jgi:hypothetical protein
VIGGAIVLRCRKTLRKLKRIMRGRHCSSPKAWHFGPKSGDRIIALQETRRVQ